MSEERDTLATLKWIFSLIDTPWKDVCLKELPEVFNKDPVYIMEFLKHLPKRIDITEEFTPNAVLAIEEGLKKGTIDDEAWSELFVGVAHMIDFPDNMDKDKDKDKDKENEEKRRELNTWAKAWLMSRPASTLPLIQSLYNGREKYVENVFQLALSQGEEEFLLHLLEGKSEDDRHHLGMRTGDILMKTTPDFKALEHLFPEILLHFFGKFEGVTSYLTSAHTDTTDEKTQSGSITDDDARGAMKVKFQYMMRKYDWFFQENFHQLSETQQERVVNALLKVPEKAIDPKSFLGILKTQGFLNKNIKTSKISLGGRKI